MRCALGRGIAWFSKGDYDQAIADYSEAIRIDPNCAYAYAERGATSLFKGDYDKAIADCNEAIGLDPKHVEAYSSRVPRGERSSTTTRRSPISAK